MSFRSPRTPHRNRAALGALLLACGLASACQPKFHDQPAFEGHFPEAREADVHRARSANEKSVRYYQ
jgi:hypothetical protein